MKLLRNVAAGLGLLLAGTSFREVSLMGMETADEEDDSAIADSAAAPS